jgi:hypothetical protein
MPKEYNGTERPYAPLLEPCIIISFDIKWKIFRYTIYIKSCSLKKNKRFFLYFKDASFAGAVAS